MGFQEAVRTCLQKYATFSGRAPRSEYWWFVLFCILVGIAAAIISMLLFGYSPTDPDSVDWVGLLCSLALLLPSLAVGVRRLHDIDRSGWWMLLILIPLLGAIVLIIFAAQRGTTGSNRFGADPLP